MQRRRMNSIKGPKFEPGCGLTRGVLFIFFVLVLPLTGAQVVPPNHIGGAPQPSGSVSGLPSVNGGTSEGTYDPEDARRIRMMNAERQRSLVADTVKLLKLANELNAEMSKEDESVPTPAELRKIADIEKLARNVKEKMKITVIGVPIYRSPNLPPIP